MSVREEAAKKLYCGITNIGDDLIEAAQAVPAAPKKKKRWIKWTAFAACMSFLVLSAWFLANIGDTRFPWSNWIKKGGPYTEAPISELNVGGGGADIPGGFYPEIMVDGRIFYWTGLAQAVMTLNGQVVTISTMNTYLPAEYTEYGSALEITSGTPVKDGQMMAGFAATGTIYTSTATPEAVYVLMSTDWFTDQYVRFISSELKSGNRIVWNGNAYQIKIGDPSLLLKELPENCEGIGRLHVVGRDALPENDLETNCQSDTTGHPLSGREVYFDPNDPEHLYVREKTYHREGDEHTWREVEEVVYLMCSRLQ